jgi:hypothetical protein
MIERESQPESLPPSPQLREALSWKLVSELHRRHPGDFTVIETHPGGVACTARILLLFVFAMDF